MKTIKKIFEKLIHVVQRYPVALTAILVLGYYLTSTVDLFKKSGNMKLTFLDYVLHYDSLIWMWVAAYVFIRLQKTKERFYNEEREKLFMQLQLEKSKIASTLLKDVTKQLQDSINNPLAVISVMTEDIRKRFVGDPAVMRRLDQIDSSLQRIHGAIKDVANYQTAQVLEVLQSEMKMGMSHSSGNGNGGGQVLSEAKG